MAKTNNYNLTKPSSEDFYDIEVINNNMDIIDSTLKSINDNVLMNESIISDLNASQITLGDEIQLNKTDFNQHKAEPNPHNITPSKIGLGNVPNVSTNDQTPTYTEASTLGALESGEKLGVAFGKIKKAISDLISHIANKSNPHGVSASQVGLGNVNNTSDANKPVSSAQATAIADAKKAGTDAQSNLNSHTSNKSNPHGVSVSQIGAAPTSHASSATTYGVGTSSNYGHLKITDSVDSEASGTAASAKALKTVNKSIEDGGWKIFKEINVALTNEAQSQKSLPISGLSAAEFSDMKIVLEGSLDGSFLAGSSNVATVKIYAGKDGYAFDLMTAKMIPTKGNTWNLGSFVAKREYTTERNFVISENGDQTLTSYAVSMGGSGTANGVKLDDFSLILETTPSTMVNTIKANLNGTLKVYTRGK